MIEIKKFKKTERTVTEMKIFMYIVTASALMRDGKMQEAGNAINEALLLLNEFDEPCCMMSYTACQLMVDFYEKTDRGDEVKKYRKILSEYEMALMEALPKNELEKMVSITRHVINRAVKNAVDTVSQAILSSKIEENNKQVYLERLSKLDLHLLETAYKTSKERITDADMRYIICFATNMEAKDISLLFNIEQTSVLTVRYRIRKKFAKEETFRMLL